MRNATNKLIKRTHLIKKGAIQVMQATAIAHQASPKAKTIKSYDTDSDALGIDNRATAFVSNDLNDFADDLTPTATVVTAFGGSQLKNNKSLFNLC